MGKSRSVLSGTICQFMQTVGVERRGERCKKRNAGCNEKRVEGCDMNFHCVVNFTAYTEHRLMY